MTNPNRPNTPSSVDAMLDRTRQRVEQIRRRRRRTAAAVGTGVTALAVALVLVLAGGNHHNAVVNVVGPSTTATTATIAPPVTTSPTSTAVTPVSTTTASNLASTTTEPAVPACSTSELSANLATGGGGAAGSFGYELTFHNTGTTTCTLAGYPGVSYVTESAGDPIGAPANRDSVTPVTTVSLAPGQTAQALLIETDSLNYPPDTCQLTSVIGLRIYPPNQTASLFVAQATKACANTADPVLKVGPVEPASSS